MTLRQIEPGSEAADISVRELGIDAHEERAGVVMLIAFNFKTCTIVLAEHESGRFATGTWFHPDPVIACAKARAKAFEYLGKTVGCPRRAQSTVVRPEVWASPSAIGDQA